MLYLKLYYRSIVDKKSNGSKSFYNESIGGNFLRLAVLINLKFSDLKISSLKNSWIFLVVVVNPYISQLLGILFSKIQL